MRSLLGLVVLLEALKYFGVISELNEYRLFIAAALLRAEAAGYAIIHLRNELALIQKPHVRPFGH
jgi:hypothetical protein